MIKHAKSGLKLKTNVAVHGYSYYFFHWHKVAMPCPQQVNAVAE
jgi:hypothetical protein